MVVEAPFFIVTPCDINPNGSPFNRQRDFAMRLPRRWELPLLLLAAASLAAGSPTAAAERPKPFYDEVYVVRGDQPLKADVFLPQGDGPFPAVLVVHGGAWRSGSKGQLSFVSRALAEAGYVAVAINYRLAPAHRFPAQIEDCKAAVRWMRDNAERFKIDPHHIAGWGYSAGGHLVALLGTTDEDDGLEDSASPAGTSTRLQAVVAGGAPCDFRILDPESDQLAFWLGGTRGERPDIYEKASPATYVTSDDPPTLFYHGDADELVMLESPQAMMAALESAQVPTEIYVIPGANHIKAALFGEAVKRGIAFLDKHLKHAAAQPVAATAEGDVTP
jgi:acetyl esterase/lipase